MVTLERASYQTQKRYAEYCGLSGDQKPIEDINNGDEFQEIDTGFTYKFNTESMQWVKQPQSGGGGSGGTTDYTQLENKPSINGITLEGNKTTEELDIIPIVDLGEVSSKFPVQITLNEEQIQTIQKDNCIVSISLEANFKIYFNKIVAAQGTIIFASLMNLSIFYLLVDVTNLEGLLDAFHIVQIPSPTGLNDAGKVPVVNPEGTGWLLGAGGGTEREWTMLGETDCSVVSGNIIYGGLDNYTEFLIKAETVKNDSSSHSGYSLYINEEAIAEYTVSIRDSSLATEYFQWVAARFNGLVWEITATLGATLETNLFLSSQQTPYNVVLNVGKSSKFELRAPLPQYQAVSGKITVWGR